MPFLSFLKNNFDFKFKMGVKISKIREFLKQQVLLKIGYLLS